MKKHLIAALVGICLANLSYAQSATVLKQKRLHKTDIISANYSGITHIKGNKYAIVSDKEKISGFRIITIDIDTINGHVLSVKTDTLRGFPLHQARDEEGICYFPQNNSFFICGEGDQQILEYDTLGLMTGLRLSVPEIFGTKGIQPNRGFESLTYSSKNHRFYTITENALSSDNNGSGQILRLLSFDDNLEAKEQYAYAMEEPVLKKKGRLHIHGISEITALPDHRIVVLEREARVTKNYIGSKVRCRLFTVSPKKENEIYNETDVSKLPENKILEKTEIADFTTRINLTRMNFANYEGMCLGPRLSDGRQTLVLIDDTQGGAGKGLIHLREHIKVIIL